MIIIDIFIHHDGKENGIHTQGFKDLMTNIGFIDEDLPGREGG